MVPPSAPAAPPLPPHPQAASPAGGPLPTGPVDFVPDPPGAGTAPPPPPPPTAPATAPSPAVPVTPPTQAAGETADTPGWPDILDTAEERPSPRQKARVPIGRPALIALGLALLGVVLLELGLLLRFGSVSYWSAVPLWSAFATLAALVSLFAVVAGSAPGSRLQRSTGWRVAAAGVAGVAVFWLLVVLPNVASDRGFVLTAALGCLGGAVWVMARRSS